MSYKIKKIESEMTRTISEILFNEAHDELLKTLTITGCKVSSDLSYAKVYFTCLSEMDKKNLEQEVNEAAVFIRTMVAQKLNLRHTPELEFIYDNSIEHAQKIEEIIKEIHEDEGVNNNEV